MSTHITSLEPKNTKKVQKSYILIWPEKIQKNINKTIKRKYREERKENSGEEKGAATPPLKTKLGKVGLWRGKVSRKIWVSRAMESTRWSFVTQIFDLAIGFICWSILNEPKYIFRLIVLSPELISWWLLFGKHLPHILDYYLYAIWINILEMFIRSIIFPSFGVETLVYQIGHIFYKFEKVNFMYSYFCVFFIYSI